MIVIVNEENISQVLVNVDVNDLLADWQVVLDGTTITFNDLQNLPPMNHLLSFIFEFEDNSFTTATTEAKLFYNEFWRYFNFFGDKISK